MKAVTVWLRSVGLVHSASLIPSCALGEHDATSAPWGHGQRYTWLARRESLPLSTAYALFPWEVWSACGQSSAACFPGAAGLLGWTIQTTVVTSRPCHGFLLNQNPSCRISIFISVFWFSYFSKYSMSNKKRQKPLPSFFAITNVVFASQTRDFFLSVFTLYPLILHFLLDRTLRNEIYAKLWCPQNIFHAFIFFLESKKYTRSLHSETVEATSAFPKLSCFCFYCWDMVADTAFWAWSS